MADRRTNHENYFETETTDSVSPTATVFPVTTTADAPEAPAFLVVEPDEGSRREIVLITDSTGTSFITTGPNRYLRGSAADSGITHPAGSKVICGPVAQHFDDLHDRVDAVVSALEAEVTTLVNALATKVAKAGDNMSGRLRIVHGSFLNHLRMERSGAPEVDVSPTTAGAGGMSVELDGSVGLRVFKDGTALLGSNQVAKIVRGEYAGNGSGSSRFISLPIDPWFLVVSRKSGNAERWFAPLSFDSANGLHLIPQFSSNEVQQSNQLRNEAGGFRVFSGGPNISSTAYVYVAVGI